MIVYVPDTIILHCYKVGRESEQRSFWPESSFDVETTEDRDSTRSQVKRLYYHEPLKTCFGSTWVSRERAFWRPQDIKMNYGENGSERQMVLKGYFYQSWESDIKYAWATEPATIFTKLSEITSIASEQRISRIYHNVITWTKAYALLTLEQQDMSRK